ncbi:MAG: DUF1572 domain-containing protein [Bacteroidetes bacterium]|uniref:DUF1572 family protein n=1 Tax=Flavobacterium sp. TaxID=239 RepID=UPI002FD94379|nr:DUF1572 domain-containing protein [Bacteroidota bacterium]
MLIEYYSKRYKNDLEKLKNELNLYRHENHLWFRNEHIPNSAGTLCLHLIGNLNHFIGHVLGKTDYQRNRDQEFVLMDISRHDLFQKINETQEIIERSFNMITNESLTDAYPLLKFEENESIEFMLVHTLSHLNYHLGQINYHRRIFDQ